MASIQSRKSEHIELALQLADQVVGRAGWSDIELVHDALPEVDLDRVSIEVEFLGATFSAPLMIAGMTGGHAESARVNATLARAAARHRLPMGLGSQRAALLDASLESGYRAAREAAPDAYLVGNLGGSQLVDQPSRGRFSTADVERAVAMIGAQAMAVHLNVLEELIQPEGDARATGVMAAIGEVAGVLSVPVILKETGGGISPAAAAKAAALPVAALDVGGAGGTNFAAIERERAVRQRRADAVRLGDTLRHWGVPTAVSVLSAAGIGRPIIATGGVRSGLDAAKALTIGAAMVGVARPLLEAALDGDEAVDVWIEGFAAELAAVMMLCGCHTVRELRDRPAVLRGGMREWAEGLGLSRRPA